VKNNGTKTPMTFSTYKQKFPSKNFVLGVQCIKFVYYVCFAALIRKRLKMDVDTSKIVYSGNNECHMSQENVIKFWVALHP